MASSPRLTELHSTSYRIDRDDLLARVDLAAVLDAVAPGDGHGARRVWRCPSPQHVDNRASVKISTDSSGTQRWRCWSGGESGTAIDAVMTAKALSVGDAIVWLNDNYAHIETLPRQRAADPRPIGRPAPEVLDYVARCEKLLWSGSGASVRDWLHARGLSDAVLRSNHVGADPGRRYLPRPKGLPGGWPAAVFPALDRGGDVAYFQARFLHPPDGRDKYDNPSRQWASNPRVAFTHRVGAARCGVFVVAEGAPDALIAAQAGFDAMGVLGSMYPDARVADEIAAHIATRDTATCVAVCFDSDLSGSGGKGAAKLIELLDERHQLVSVVKVSPPHGCDLTDWAQHSDDWIDAFTNIATPQRLDVFAPGVQAAPAASMPVDMSVDMSL